MACVTLRKFQFQQKIYHKVLDAVILYKIFKTNKSQQYQKNRFSGQSNLKLTIKILNVNIKLFSILHLADFQWTDGRE